MRVYDEYLKGENFIATSFVPQGQKELALENSTPAEVVEEQIVQGKANEEFVLPDETEYERTGSSFDRTIEPPYGENPDVKVPDVWEGSLENGMQIFGIENNELPLVQFTIEIEGVEKPAALVETLTLYIVKE